MADVSALDLGVLAGVVVVAQGAFRFGEAALSAMRKGGAVVESMHPQEMRPECAALFGRIEEGTKAVHHRLTEQREILTDIQHQVRLTNGRVTRLEVEKKV